MLNVNGAFSLLICSGVCVCVSMPCVQHPLGFILWANVVSVVLVSTNTFLVL